MGRNLKLTLAILLSAFVFLKVSPLLLKPSNRSLANQALSAESESKRTQAAQSLVSRDKEAIAEIRRVASESKDTSVKVLCLLSLSRLYDYELINEMFQLLSNEDAHLRAAAAKAITRLLGAEYRFPVDGSVEARSKVAKRMRDDWEIYKESPIFKSNLERLTSKGE